ncbi:MAG: hypothetical protein K0S79_1331 [Nitrospira sp.]|nr:hypothetical protein [Nitrospira sp.]
MAAKRRRGPKSRRRRNEPTPRLHCTKPSCPLSRQGANRLQDVSTKNSPNTHERGGLSFALHSAYSADTNRFSVLNDHDKAAERPSSDL